MNGIQYISYNKLTSKSKLNQIEYILDEISVSKTLYTQTVF